MFICYGHELVISRCPRLLTFFSCLILATKRKMGRGWKFSFLLLIVGMLCQCKYSLTQVCKHWTQEAVLSSFFYLVSQEQRNVVLNLPVVCILHEHNVVGVFYPAQNTFTALAGQLQCGLLSLFKEPKERWSCSLLKNLSLKRGNVWCMVWTTKIIYCDPSYTEAAY